MNGPRFITTDTIAYALRHNCEIVTRSFGVSLLYPEIKWFKVEIIGGPLDGKVREFMKPSVPQKIETEVSHRQWKTLTYSPRLRDGKHVLVHPDFIAAFDKHNSPELIIA